MKIRDVENRMCPNCFNNYPSIGHTIWCTFEEEKQP